MPKTWILLVTLSCCMFANIAMADDADGDQIDDAFEQQLLDQFAPIINGDQGCPGSWQVGVPVPVEPSWIVRNGFLFTRSTGIIVRSPSLSDFINIYCTRSDAEQMSVGYNDEDSIWGYSMFSGESTSWAQAAATGAGIFGRVWRPWPSHPKLYSVQYFILLTANTNIEHDAGYHDCDWLCLDYCVDANNNNPPYIRHAVYHNHGKQLLLTRESIEFENGHPVAYLEPGTNEPWPNRSAASGFDSWPNTNGFAKNWLFDEGFVGIDFVNEEFVTVRHSGNGCRYLSNQARPIRNIGETGHPMGSDECRAVLLFPGEWGFESGGSFLDGLASTFGTDITNPRGPSHNAKIWDRMFNVAGDGLGSNDTANACPFSRLEDPLYPDLDRTIRDHSERWGSCEADAGDGGFLFFHCGTRFLPIAYVSQGSATVDDGIRTRPFATLAEGIDRVAEYGVLRIYGGPPRPNVQPPWDWSQPPLNGGPIHSAPITITKPMTIEAYGGTVFIGN